MPLNNIAKAELLLLTESSDNLFNNTLKIAKQLRETGHVGLAASLESEAHRLYDVAVEKRAEAAAEMATTVVDHVEVQRLLCLSCESMTAMHDYCVKMVNKVAPEAE